MVDNVAASARHCTPQQPPPLPATWQQRFVAYKKLQQAILQGFFGRLANVFYDYPWCFLCGSFLLTVLLSVGLWPGVPGWIDGAERLYSLQNSLSRTHGDLHRLLFDESRTRNSNVLITLSDPEHDNLLQWRHVSTLLYIDEIVRGAALEPLAAQRVAYDPPPPLLTSGSVGKAGGPLVFSDLCHIRGDHECEGPPLVDFLREGFETPRGKKPQPDQLPDLVAIDGFAVSLRTLRMHPLELLLGGLETRKCERPLPLPLLTELKERQFPPGLINQQALVVDEAAGTLTADCVVGAKAALMTYSLRDDTNENNAAWEAALIAALRPLRAHWQGLRVDVAAFRTRDDELKASTSESGDLAFVVLTFLVLLGYTTSINMSRDLFMAKPYSGMAGAVAAVLGLVSGMGLCTLCGLSLVPTAFVCPFLILGIGVDDMFVIMNAYALAFELRGRQRCQTALSGAGTAISLTTVTSLTSFAIGSLSPYLAIRNFCIFCSAGLLFGYIYVFTVFFPALCLESRREKNRQLCCYGLPATADDDMPVAPVKKDHEHFLFKQITCMVDSYLGGEKSSAASIEPKGNVGRGSRAGILKYYGPLLLSAKFKGAVILAFLVLLGFSVYGILHIQRGLDLTDLAPPDSYLRLFDESMARWVNRFDLPTDLFFVNGETQWWSPGYREQVVRLTEALLAEGVAVKVVDPLAIVTGDPHYRPWMISGERRTFEAALYNAVADPKGPYYAQHRQSFLWQGNHLRAWKLLVLPPFMTSSQQRATWMVKLRRICRKHSVYIPSGGGAAPQVAIRGGVPSGTQVSPGVPWNYMMHYHESDLRVIFFVALEMSTAGGTLAAVTFLWLPDVLSGAIVTSVMCMIDMTIVGFMYFWNIKLNMISMVNLLISIGFAIDYSTHVAHTFLECRGRSRERRAVEALVLMGNPVLHGAAASVLGVGMLGFSKSHIFRIFFKMMTLIVIFGVAYGAIFMPVILSLIGTFTHHHHPEPPADAVAALEAFKLQPPVALLPRLLEEDEEDLEAVSIERLPVAPLCEETAAALARTHPHAPRRRPIRERLATTQLHHKRRPSPPPLQIAVRRKTSRSLPPALLASPMSSATPVGRRLREVEARLLPLEEPQLPLSRAMAATVQMVTPFHANQQQLQPAPFNRALLCSPVGATLTDLRPQPQLPRPRPSSGVAQKSSGVPQSVPPSPAPLVPYRPQQLQHKGEQAPLPLSVAVARRETDELKSTKPTEESPAGGVGRQRTATSLQDNSTPKPKLPPPISPPPRALFAETDIVRTIPEASSQCTTQCWNGDASDTQQDTMPAEIELMTTRDRSSALDSRGERGYGGVSRLGSSSDDEFSDL